MASEERFAVPVRVLCWALLAGLPAVMTALYLLTVSSALSFGRRWGLGLIAVVVWIGAAIRSGFEVRHAFEKLFGLLSSFSHGDYSPRLVAPSTGDAFAGCVTQINKLGQQLSSTRLQSTEAAVMLEAISEEVDAGIFLLEDERIYWLNRSGAELLRGSRASLRGKRTEESGLSRILALATERVGPVRWEVREKVVYEKGNPHRLLIVSDITQSLRNEERSAWQRMVRVLSHEINNSLIPLKTLSSELAELMACAVRPADWQSDVHTGLERIAARADRLGRFISGYARLMSLPPPVKKLVSVSDLLRNVAALERRVAVEVVAGPPLHVQADQAQVEQALINLLKNAAEATLHANRCTVTISWYLDDKTAVVLIRDEGSGITPNQNLFVPFYTTKPDGSGIGLVFSREIVEAHQGSLQLRNRSDCKGCEAVVRLPL